MGEQLLLRIGKDLGELGQHLNGWLSRHAVNVVVILIGAWLTRHFAERLVNNALKATLRDDLYPTKADRYKRLKTLSELVGAMVRITIYIIATIMLITELGINTAPLLASAGVLGVALGFGAQSLIKDFVSGIFIIAENQYRVGDEVKLGDAEGIVEAITIRTTILRDLNGDVHHVPNGTINVTTNRSMDFGRINEDITVSLDTDLDQLNHIINHIGEELAAMTEFHNKIQEPPKMASVRGFAPNGVTVKILGKTSPSVSWKIRSEMYKKLKKNFAAHKISLASQPPIKK